MRTFIRQYGRQTTTEKTFLCEFLFADVKKTYSVKQRKITDKHMLKMLYLFGCFNVHKIYTRTCWCGPVSCSIQFVPVTRVTISSICTSLKNVDVLCRLCRCHLVNAIIKLHEHSNDKTCSFLYRLMTTHFTTVTYN